MNFPDTFPAEVKTKLSAVDSEITKNNGRIESLKKQITVEDMKKAAKLTGLDSQVSTKSLVAGVPGTKEETPGFWDTYKYYIIGGGALIILVVGFFIFKRKG